MIARLLYKLSLRAAIRYRNTGILLWYDLAELLMKWYNLIK